MLPIGGEKTVKQLEVRKNERNKYCIKKKEEKKTFLVQKNVCDLIEPLSNNPKILNSYLIFKEKSKTVKIVSGHIFGKMFSLGRGGDEVAGKM